MQYEFRAQQGQPEQKKKETLCAISTLRKRYISSCSRYSCRDNSFGNSGFANSSSIIKVEIGPAEVDGTMPSDPVDSALRKIDYWKM